MRAPWRSKTNSDEFIQFRRVLILSSEIVNGYVQSSFVTHALRRKYGFRFGQKLQSIPSKFKKDVAAFSAYLGEKSCLSIRVTRRNLNTGELRDCVFPYVHRWTEIYRRRVLCKLYYIEEFFDVNPKDVTMITLTTYQRGKDHQECLDLLKDSRSKFLDACRSRFGSNSYIWVLEPHETGYAHCHMAFFKRLTADMKDSLRCLWSLNYRAGSIDHGLDFSEPKASSDGVFKAGSIAKIRAYFMKYISKNIRDTDFETHEMLFNALLKKTSSRLWGSSRDLSRYVNEQMESYREKKHGKRTDSSVWEFVRVSVVDEEGNVVCDRPKFKQPEFKHVWVLVPELSVPFLTKSMGNDFEKYEYNPDTGRYDRYHKAWVEVHSGGYA